MGRCYLILLFSVITSFVFAQKVKTVKADYLYNGSSDISPNEAKRIALERAKIQAIADEFGTVISQSNETHVQNSNMGSDVRFFSLSSSDVKGEWIETIGEPKYNVSYENNMIVVSCHVEGKAREMPTSECEFVAKLLRNGSTDAHEDAHFRNGDQICLSFLSPAAGFLACYLVDETNTAYCLLPYPGIPDGNAIIKANKRYVYFNRVDNTTGYDPSVIDEYYLTCEEGTVANYLYVLYSPNRFIKPADIQSESASRDRILPRELPFKDFQTWLTKRRLKDPQLQLQKNTIFISNK